MLQYDVQVRINKIWVMTHLVSSITKCDLKETPVLQIKFIDTLNKSFTTTE